MLRARPPFSAQGHVPLLFLRERGRYGLLAVSPSEDVLGILLDARHQLGSDDLLADDLTGLCPRFQLRPEGIAETGGLLMLVIGERTNAINLPRVEKGFPAASRSCDAPSLSHRV